MIFFNVEEAREFLKANSVVFTLRKQRREGHDVAVHGSYYKWKRIGSVNVKFIDQITDPTQLEGYVEQSGFETVKQWMSKAHPEAGCLYKVSLLEPPETNPGTGKPLHWVVQYCSSVRPYKGPFTWADCISWITIDKFKTKEEADSFLEAERKNRKHSFVGAALRVYPIYPSVTLNKYHSSNPRKVGYRVGEPQETNAKKLIEFEVIESGNVPMLDDLAAVLHCTPTLDAIKTAIDSQFGPDAIGMWLCDSPEWAVKRYGPGEAYSVEIPPDAIVATDLGEDGKLRIWRKPGSNPLDKPARIQKILEKVRAIEKREAEKRGLKGYLDCDEVVSKIAGPLFKKEGIEVEEVVGTVRGQSHAWLETPDLIIDPTADQFKLPKVQKKPSPLYRRLTSNPTVPETLYKSLAAEVPDVNDPNLINYWKTVDDRQIYLEGWCDKCFAGTGIGEYETQAKINYAEDLTRLVLPRKAKERGLELIEGRFVETPDKNFLVGVTVGVYRKKTENPGVFVEIRFLKDTPMIIGVDMKQYGPFKKGDVAALPKENARVLIKMKIAERRVKPAAEVPFKKVMKGEVLTGYVEAAKVKRLGEPKEEVTPYMEEKIPLILSKLRAMQKITGMVREADLYDAVRPSVTKAGFDEIISYLLRKGEIYSPRPDFLRSTEKEVMLAGEDTARLADLFLDLLRDAEVSLPSRFKGEFEKAMDIYKPYDENVELVEEAAHRIILRETGKEYPVGEALRKAREKVEKLLREIREAKGE